MVTIQEKSNGQFVVTVDKGIAEAMNLSGADANWKVKSGNTLELQIKERPSDGGDE